MTSKTQTRAALRAAFQEEGARGALGYLNSHTGYRFTAMYRFRGEFLTPICVFDREDPANPTPPPDVPLSATYCMFQKLGARSLAIEDALGDPRLAEHPARAAVRSYIGVPLRDLAGNIVGSACHFSFLPHWEEVNVEMLEALSELVEARSLA